MESALAALEEAIGPSLGRGSNDEVFVYVSTNAEAVTRVWPGASVWLVTPDVSGAWMVRLGSSIFYSWQAALEQQQWLWASGKNRSRGSRLPQVHEPPLD